MENTDKDKISLQEWTRRISEEEMPVFAHTARSISAASTEDDTSTAALAHLILRDSTMTARVLRLANSVYYNPTGQAINTVSRAIVFLGFNVVRSMALTISILEPLLKGIQHEHALEEMARSFHTAVQAKTLAQQRGNPDAESVFVAALLQRLGNMAFWCFPYGQAKAMDDAYAAWHDPVKAEQEVLGFSLRQLTITLNDEWHLSSLLNDSLKSHHRNDRSLQDLSLANQLVHAVEQGWGSLATAQSIPLIAEHVGLDEAACLKLLQQSAFEAAQTAIEYGAQAASKYIPLPQLEQDEEATLSTQAPLPHDYSLQMSILRELTAMLHEKVDLNAVLGTIIEGIYRALGMERTVMAFVALDEGRLKAKYVLGDNKESLKRCFDFPVGPEHGNIFSELLQNKQAFWCNVRTRKDKEHYLTPPIRQCLGTLDFFAMPIWIGQQGRGMIYADCKLSGRKLTMEEFQTFTHFSEYATIAFDLLSIKKNN